MKRILFLLITVSLLMLTGCDKAEWPNYVDVNKMQELAISSRYEYAKRIPVVYTNTTKQLWWDSTSTYRANVIAKVTAGVDINEVSVNDGWGYVKISIPNAKVFYPATIDPTSWSDWYEAESWGSTVSKDELYKKYQNDAIAQITSEATNDESNIIDEANKKTRNIIDTYLSNNGARYNWVPGTNKIIVYDIPEGLRAAFN